MKLGIALAFALVLFGCRKEDRRFNVRLDATCKMCAVEYSWGGQTMRDTVIGDVQYTHVDGVSTADTLPVKATWNVVRTDGQSIYFKACRLRQTDDGTIAIRASGDIAPIERTSVYPECATIDAAITAP